MLEENSNFPAWLPGKIARGLDVIIVSIKTEHTPTATIISKYISETVQKKVIIFKINVLSKEIVPDNFIGGDVKIFDG